MIDDELNEPVNIDYVIKDEYQMDLVIKYLLESLDKNNKENTKERWRPAFGKVGQKKKNAMDLRKALCCYRNLRIKMKISYAAFKKKISVKELLLT